MKLEDRLMGSRSDGVTRIDHDLFVPLKYRYKRPTAHTAAAAAGYKSAVYISRVKHVAQPYFFVRGVDYETGIKRRCSEPEDELAGIGIAYLCQHRRRQLIERINGFEPDQSSV